MKIPSECGIIRVFTDRNEGVEPGGVAIMIAGNDKTFLIEMKESQARMLLTEMIRALTTEETFNVPGYFKV